jgi:hypothetical protein
MRLSSPELRYEDTGDVRFAALAIGYSQRAGVSQLSQIPEWALKACEDFASQQLSGGYRFDEHELGDYAQDGELLDLIAHRIMVLSYSFRRACLSALACLGEPEDDSTVRRLRRLWNRSLDESERKGLGRTNRWLEENRAIAVFFMVMDDESRAWYQEQYYEIVKKHGVPKKFPLLLPGLPLPKCWR